MSNLNPEQFGMSQREMSKMAGEAIGAHIYESMEKILTGEEGGFKQAAQARRYEKMRDFPEKSAKLKEGHYKMETDEEGGPRASITTGNWTSTYHGGHSVDHSHRVHGPLDLTSFTDYSNPEHGPFGPGPKVSFEDFKKAHTDFLEHVKTDYPKEYQ